MPFLLFCAVWEENLKTSISRSKVISPAQEHIIRRNVMTSHRWSLVPDRGPSSTLRAFHQALETTHKTLSLWSRLPHVSVSDLRRVRKLRRSWRCLAREITPPRTTLAKIYLLILWAHIRSTAPSAKSRPSSPALATTLPKIRLQKRQNQLTRSALRQGLISNSRRPKASRRPQASMIQYQRTQN